MIRVVSKSCQMGKFSLMSLDSGTNKKYKHYQQMNWRGLIKTMKNCFRDSRRGNGWRPFKGYKLPFGWWKTSGTRQSPWLYSIINVRNATELYIFKQLESLLHIFCHNKHILKVKYLNVKLMLCVFCHNKNWSNNLMMLLNPYSALESSGRTC